MTKSLEEDRAPLKLYRGGTLAPHTLNWPQDVVKPITDRRAKGQGNILVATLAYEHVTEACVVFGRIGASAKECPTQIR